MVIVLLKKISPSKINSCVPIIIVSIILLFSAVSFFTFELENVIIDKFEFFECLLLILIFDLLLSAARILFKCNKFEFDAFIKLFILFCYSFVSFIEVSNFSSVIVIFSCFFGRKQHIKF